MRKLSCRRKAACSTNRRGSISLLAWAGSSSTRCGARLSSLGRGMSSCSSRRAARPENGHEGQRCSRRRRWRSGKRRQWPRIPSLLVDIRTSMYVLMGRGVQNAGDCIFGLGIDWPFSYDRGCQNLQVNMNMHQSPCLPHWRP